MIAISLPVRFLVASSIVVIAAGCVGVGPIAEPSPTQTQAPRATSSGRAGTPAPSGTPTSGTPVPVAKPEPEATPIPEATPGEQTPTPVPTPQATEDLPAPTLSLEYVFQDACEMFDVTKLRGQEPRLFAVGMCAGFEGAVAWQSPDGRSWQRAHESESAVDFVAVTDDGQPGGAVFVGNTSVAASAWHGDLDAGFTEFPLPTTAQDGASVDDVARAGESFMAVGIQYPDGMEDGPTLGAAWIWDGQALDWTEVPAPAESEWFQSVVADGSDFVVGGTTQAGRTAVWRYDLETGWSDADLLPRPIDETFGDLVDAQTVIRRTDGLTDELWTKTAGEWSGQELPHLVLSNDLLHTENGWISVGTQQNDLGLQGVVALSQDGSEWNVSPIGTMGEQNFLNAVELFQGQLVVVGDAVFIGPAPGPEYFQ